MSPSSLFVLLLSAMPAADPYRDVVRVTEPLTPVQQQATFHLPPGFAIQLVAAEPDIQKPMNLAFDGAGRLWVSDSVEYPYQAKDRPGRDSIKVLADRDGDGRAEQITTFVDQLNIPIGLYPYRDGVVAYSIPNIWHFADTDGDGRADRREILYGPLGEPRDTHGMQNGFRRGFDGWLYVNHGFNNETTITARDGSSIKLHSGNSYRIRLDGSRVEQFTWGQVNPFGSTFLPDGDLVNADCHSKPLSLLLRGGYYPSFGKPDDGLGFVQPIMDHSHGSTAIAGAAVCTSPAWPAEYHGRLFVGNVMTCRVHMDRLDYTGSTMHAVEQPDFLVCDDPWFRPVDLRFGPNGALYIADFYNRIIGHYEVPLDHPQRDRHRGRIWRVVYVGEAGDANGGEAVPDLNLATAGVDALIEMLGDPNLTRRELAADQLSDRIGSSAVEALRKAAADASNAWRRIHAGWLLQRLGQLDETLLLAATRDRDWLVRTHAMRVAAERSDWSQPLREAAFDLLRDEHPRVRRAAADALGQHPHASAVAALLAALAKAPTDDAHLRQMIRIALRNQLRDSPAFPALEANAASADLDALADIAVAVPNEQAAGFLVSYLKTKRESAETRPANSDRTLRLLSHAARYLPADQVSSLVQLARETTVDDLDLQSSIISTVRESLARRGLEPNEDFRRWAADVAGQLLDTDAARQTAWTSVSGDNPWDLERRNSADGQTGDWFLSSLPGGEQKTGVLRSPAFVIPPTLEFFLCGHRGFPDQPASDANRVRLRLVDDGRVIAEAMPPRNDTAQRVRWDLAEFAGQQGQIELIDGMNINAYAWLAVARFHPSVVRIPTSSPRLVDERRTTALELVDALKLNELKPQVRELMLTADLPSTIAAQAANSLLATRSSAELYALTPLLTESGAQPELQARVVRAIEQWTTADHNSVGSPDADGAAAEEHLALLREALRSAPTGLQQTLAERLAASTAGADRLLMMIEQGHASARLLQQPNIQQKLSASSVEQLDQRIAKLTVGLPAVDEQLAKLLVDRIAAFHSASPSLENGQRLFTKHCAACHQIGGQGAMVGPQLDGIGLRGVPRLVEDVLDPNRNVDAAFRTVVLAMEDGRVLTGLPRREEGESLIFANQEGKEFSVTRSAIDVQRLSPLSLMPANLSTTLSPAEFNDLLGYLLSQQKAR